MAVIFKPDLHETIQWFRLDTTYLDLLCSLAVFLKPFLMICLLYPQGQTYVWAKNTISILFHISIGIFALFYFVLFFLVVMLALFGSNEIPIKVQALCIYVSPQTKTSGPHPPAVLGFSYEEKAWHVSRAHPAAEETSSQDTYLGTRTAKGTVLSSVSSYWGSHETVLIHCHCQHPNAASGWAPSPTPLFPQEGNPCTWAKRALCALFMSTVRRCSVAPQHPGTSGQETETTFLREEGQGKSEVKNKKHLKRGKVWKSMKTSCKNS